MAGRDHPLRQGEGERKRRTPKKRVPRPEDGPCVRLGDVLILKGPGGSPVVGVVVCVGYHRGPHMIVDERGEDRKVYKPTADGGSSPFNDAHAGVITVVGHDDEWLEFEQRSRRRRRELTWPHKQVAWRHTLRSEGDGER